MSIPGSPAVGAVNDPATVLETNRLELHTHEPSGRRMINQYIMCVSPPSARHSG